MATKNIRNLCRVCSTPYEPGTVFCGHCGRQLEAGPIGPTILQQGGNQTDKSTVRLSNNILPTQLTPTYPVTPPLPPTAPKQASWTTRKFTLAIASVLFVLIFIGAGLFLVAYQLGRNSVQVEVTHQPTMITVSGSTITSTGTSKVEPTATLTTAPQIITKNLIIPCIIGCTNISLKLTTIVIDTIHQQSRWNFTLTNNGDPNTISFATLELEDGSGQKYEGGGPAATDSWVMNSGQSIQTFTTFDGIHGKNYLLNVKMCCIEDYQTEVITF